MTRYEINLNALNLGRTIQHIQIKANCHSLQEAEELAEEMANALSHRYGRMLVDSVYELA